MSRRIQLSEIGSEALLDAISADDVCDASGVPASAVVVANSLIVEVVDGFNADLVCASYQCTRLGVVYTARVYFWKLAGSLRAGSSPQPATSYVNTLAGCYISVDWSDLLEAKPNPTYSGEFNELPSPTPPGGVTVIRLNHVISTSDLGGYSAREEIIPLSGTNSGDLVIGVGVTGSGPFSNATPEYPGRLYASLFYLQAATGDPLWARNLCSAEGLGYYPLGTYSSSPGGGALPSDGESSISFGAGLIDDGLTLKLFNTEDDPLYVYGAGGPVAIWVLLLRAPTVIDVNS